MDGRAFRGLWAWLYLAAFLFVVVLIIIGSFFFGRWTVSKYQAEWQANSKNEAFWNEVLVGRKIVSLTWDEKGISGFTLDSGEWVGVKKNEHDVATLFIKD